MLHFFGAKFTDRPSPLCALSLPVVDDEPRLPPPEVEVELEGEGEGDVVDPAHLEDHDVHVDVQRLTVRRGNEVLSHARCSIWPLGDRTELGKEAPLVQEQNNPLPALPLSKIDGYSTRSLSSMSLK